MATVGGINSNGLNFTGLATGIDTQKIIDGLTSINANRVTALQDKKDKITLQQSTFAALQGTLFDLQSKLTNLSRSVAGAFDTRKATSSNDAAITAAASSSAAPGTYNLTVNALAQAQQTASAGFADPAAKIKEGSLEIRVGSAAGVTINIDSRNNTLQGLADAINAAGAGVRAGIINDGSATPYKLVLTSSQTGAANTISVTNNLTSGTGAAIDPVATTLQAASDAEVKLGSGAGAMTVKSATNQLNSLIPGVTLNLKQADPTKAVTVSVGADTSAASKAVSDFVTSFNAVIDFIDKRDDYNADANAAGILLGNRETADLQADLNSALTTVVGGVKADMNRLSALGVTLNNKGRLEVDAAKLDQALSGQVTGVSLDDVKRMFALTGSSSNPGVSFVLGTDKTKPSAVATPYQVNVTSPATRALLTATNPLGSTVTITPPDTALSIKLNGLAAVGITIEPGTYTPDQVASLLQQRINTNPALSANPVVVALDSSNKLTISSQLYGSSSKVEFAGGGALAALGFSGTETAAGTNVAGNFVVDGVTETATGSGQVLTGATGNKNTSGLQVRSGLAAAGTADLTVTQGLAARLNQVLTKYLDTGNGRLVALDKQFKAQTDDIDVAITKQNTLVDEQKERLSLRFAAMESAVNNLKGLQTQLASLVSSSSS
jgi:flagellar hook-associated protein 2